MAIRVYFERLDPCEKKEAGQKTAFRRFKAEGGDLSWLNSEPSYANPLLQELITKADEFLYIAKENGRNRVEF